MVTSVSGLGDCYGNAPMVSIWGKLKQKMVQDQHFNTRDQARRAVFVCIEVFYNYVRLHSAPRLRQPRAVRSSDGPTMTTPLSTVRGEIQEQPIAGHGGVG